MQQFFAGSSGVDDGICVFIGSILRICSLKLKVENLVCWLPVLCSEGAVATTVTRLGPFPGKERVLYRASLTGQITDVDGIFSALTPILIL